MEAMSIGNSFKSFAMKAEENSTWSQEILPTPKAILRHFVCW